MDTNLVTALMFAWAEADIWHRLAMTDGLTGLPNKRAILKFAEENPGGAWVMIDLNDFKAYQDGNGGHEEGDRVLRHFANWLVDNTRSFDCYDSPMREPDLVAARLHGDEFAVYVQGNDPMQGAARIAADVILLWRYATVTASAGTGLTEKDADEMLYAVKNGFELVDTYNSEEH